MRYLLKTVFLQRGWVDYVWRTKKTIVSSMRKDRHVARITLNKPEKGTHWMKSSPGALRGASKARDDDDAGRRTDGNGTRSVPAAMWRGFRNSAWRKAFLS